MSLVSPRRVGAALAVATFALSACTAQGSIDVLDSPTPAPAGGTEAPSSKSATPSADPSTPSPPPRPPPAHACYRIGIDDAAEPSSNRGPVPCSRRHTSRTFFVGRLDTTVHGDFLPVESDAVQDQPARRCPRRLANFLGGDRETRRLSRFQATWFTPTAEQADAGARWFRCDVVLVAAKDTLGPLPTGVQLRGVLDDPSQLGRFGLCGTAAPGANGFHRVVCRRKHSWQTLAAIGLSGGRKYPGTRVVRRAGQDPCRERARAESANPLKFRFGWEWPTRRQWQRGQHYGYCWVPDR